MKREDRGFPNNTRYSHKKTLQLIFEIIRQCGSISEPEFFEYFSNRKDAIACIRVLTNGQYHLLNYRIEGGARYYSFSRYYLQKHDNCSGGVPA